MNAHVVILVSALAFTLSASSVGNHFRCTAQSEETKMLYKGPRSVVRQQAEEKACTGCEDFYFPETCRITFCEKWDPRLGRWRTLFGSAAPCS